MMFIPILIWIVTGAIIGWLASLIMKSRLNLLWSIILGIAGSAVGGFIAGLFDIHGTGLGALAISVAGACLLVFVARLIRQ